MANRIPHPGFSLKPSECSVLHSLRLNGALSKAELARLSGMSAQGISVIVDRLLGLSLVKKGPKQRGRVGQPSTPIVLDPDGAFAIGIFIGRSETEIVVINFEGVITAEKIIAHDAAEVAQVADIVFETVTDLADVMSAGARKLLTGIGLAAGQDRFDLFADGLLAPLVGGAAGGPVLADRLKKHFALPVHCMNDIRAACIAELTLGSARDEKNTLYFNVDHMLGSGTILEGRLTGEEHRQSSALHALAVPGLEIDGREGRVVDFASLEPLERQIGAAGYDFAEQCRRGFSDTEDQFQAWYEDAAFALGAAIHSACATIHFDRVLIESRIPAPQLNMLIAGVRDKVASYDMSDAKVANLSAGMFGGHSRALGAAMAPFCKAFGPEESPRRRRVRTVAA